ncbi:TPA: hypothetical protein ACH3X2_001194, partial [Trebouxia sp. C0005]
MGHWTAPGKEHRQGKPRCSTKLVQTTWSQRRRAWISRSKYEVLSTCDALLYTFKGRRRSYLVVGQGADQTGKRHSHDAEAHSRKESKGACMRAIWGAAAKVKTQMNVK